VNASSESGHSFALVTLAGVLSADHPLAHNLRFPAFLARRLGAHVTVTVGPESFRFEGPGLRDRDGFEAATALRIGDDLKLTAIGDEALAPAAPGVLIRPFQVQPERGAPWLQQELLVQYCRYYLTLARSDSALPVLLGVGPVVTVRDADSLRSFFRGQETEVLDRVFRAAGASVVQFVP
jgi:hypothetical protein